MEGRPEEILEVRSVLAAAARGLTDVLLRSDPSLSRADVLYFAEMELDYAAADVFMHVRGAPDFREAM